MEIFYIFNRVIYKNQPVFLSNYFYDKMLNARSLTIDKLIDFLYQIDKSSELHGNYNSDKNKIYLLNDSGDKEITIHLPWLLPSFDSIIQLLTFLETKSYRNVHYLIILIQAGYGALGKCETGKLIEHRLIRKYMVRKKQGKAQITYLHKKGKSRAGSRIRLAQTIQFFEELNQQINNWIEQISQDRLLISCSPRLWGLLFKSKIKPEFEKKDKRLFKIPVDVKIPDYNELLRIHKLAQNCSFEFEDDKIPDVFTRLINKR